MKQAHCVLDGTPADPPPEAHTNARCNDYTKQYAAAVMEVILVRPITAQPKPKLEYFSWI